MYLIQFKLLSFRNYVVVTSFQALGTVPSHQHLLNGSKSVFRKEGGSFFRRVYVMLSAPGDVLVVRILRNALVSSNSVMGSSWPVGGSDPFYLLPSCGTFAALREGRLRC